MEHKLKAVALEAQLTGPVIGVTLPFLEQLRDFCHKQYQEQLIKLGHCMLQKTHHDHLHGVHTEACLWAERYDAAFLIVDRFKRGEENEASVLALLELELGPAFFKRIDAVGFGREFDAKIRYEGYGPDKKFSPNTLMVEYHVPTTATTS